MEVRARNPAISAARPAAQSLHANASDLCHRSGYQTGVSGVRTFKVPTPSGYPRHHPVDSMFCTLMKQARASCHFIYLFIYVFVISYNNFIYFHAACGCFRKHSVHTLYWLPESICALWSVLHDETVPSHVADGTGFSDTSKYVSSFGIIIDIFPHSCC